VSVALHVPTFDFPALDLGGLMQLADAVVVARADAVAPSYVTVLDPGADPSGDVSYPVTPVTFTVVRVLVGDLAAGDVFTVMTTGGQVAQGRVDVPGDPVAGPGTTSLLFLQALDVGARRYLTVGGGTGRYLVDEDDVLSPSIQAPDLLPDGGALTGMTVDDVDALLPSVVTPSGTAPRGTSGTTAPAVDD
jgi:hypothetical protein